MKKPKIFIACDTSNLKAVRKIISHSMTDKLNLGYKFGLEFFYSKNGRRFISKLRNKEIFLDLKLNDIPNTCVAAINSLADLKNISYMTVHINGGYEMLKAVKKASKSQPTQISVMMYSPRSLKPMSTKSQRARLKESYQTSRNYKSNRCKSV